MSEAIKILKVHGTERNFNEALLNKKWLHFYIIFVSKANKILKVQGTERRFNKALPNDRCDHFYPSIIFEYDYENTRRSQELNFEMFYRLNKLECLSLQAFLT